MNSVPTFYFDALLRYWKLVTFSTFTMLNHAHQYCQYHLVVNFNAQSVEIDFDVNLHAKIQLHL